VISGEILARTEIRIEPLPMPRPRSQPGGHGRPFIPPKFRAYLEELQAALLEARVMRAPVAGPIALGLEFWRSSRRRCDLDNLVKGIWDAGNGVLWVDDSQIIHLEASKLVGPPPGSIRVTAVLIGAPRESAEKAENPLTGGA